jgi:hypothetical protein
VIENLRKNDEIDLEARLYQARAYFCLYSLPPYAAEKLEPSKTVTRDKDLNRAGRTAESSKCLI